MLVVFALQNFALKSCSSTEKIFLWKNYLDLQSGQGARSPHELEKHKINKTIDLKHYMRQLKISGGRVPVCFVVLQ